MVPADDDEGVAALELGPDVGDADAVEEQVPLAAEVLHRVGGEGLELHREAGPGLAHLGLDEVEVERPCRWRRPVVDEDVAAHDGHELTLLEVVHDVLADVVDQRDARLDEDLRAEVRVPAGDRRRRH